MIAQAFFNVIMAVFSLLLGWLPTIDKLPSLIGVNTDSVLSNGVSYFHRLILFFPPFQSILTASLFYLTFRIVMLLLKLVLGSRAPHH
jgi:hypothetical protein